MVVAGAVVEVEAGVLEQAAAQDGVWETSHLNVHTD